VPVKPSRADDRSADRSHRLGTIASIAIAVFALAVVLVVPIVTVGRDRDRFDTATPTQLATALRGQDLTVCGTQQSTGSFSNDAVSTEVLSVALDGQCDDALDLQANAYRDAAQRDAAARSAEGVDRGRSAGTVWTWHQYVLYLQADEASGDPAVRDRIVDALDAVGAR
jgi:hypothetical protein